MKLPRPETCPAPRARANGFQQPVWQGAVALYPTVEVVDPIGTTCNDSDGNQASSGAFRRLLGAGAQDLSALM